MLTLLDLGRRVAEKRGGAGLRSAAADIGISAATLCRVENGHHPGLETFCKICLWLQVDPGELLGGASHPIGAAVEPRAGAGDAADRALVPDLS